MPHRWHIEPCGSRFCVADDEGHRARRPFFTEATAELYAAQQNARELGKPVTASVESTWASNRSGMTTAIRRIRIQ